MSKKRLTYFAIMLLLLIANLYLVFTFLRGNSLAIIFVSLAIAYLSDKVAKWSVVKIYGNDSERAK
ncbi:hypothetical protein SAMN04488100_1446 [Alkalibacterium putridalgicola]|uniref:Uncharacterized protein n=1 Tax=Alkalibacterium putridalgicola TaxID=426703 RepID=A0A1H7X2E7_9LACT|nr:hypothetical protein [Alkalibacterium putridalgicola]GEK90228.1 hypothetical protein APU01nite_22670 [Alkalibacterium putridalgicola]SEM27933.1 hypothetical protein SAMN04488100_1446 [Alkalibacterium putridalgicola]